MSDPVAYAVGKPGGAARIIRNGRQAPHQVRDGEVLVDLIEEPSENMVLTISADDPFTLVESTAPTTWNDIKVERNQKLDNSVWTTAGESPLSVNNQQEWSNYRRLLHRLTIDYATPDTVVWPDPPELIYPE